MPEHVSNGNTTLWRVVGPILAVTLLSIGGWMYVNLSRRVDSLEEHKDNNRERLARIETKLDLVLEELDAARKHLAMHDDYTKNHSPK